MIKAKEEKIESPKPSIFSKGYKELNNKMQKKSAFTMSCFNCDYFYQAVGDRDEVCQNPDVLSFDMVVSDSHIYCNRWRYTQRNFSNADSPKTIKSLFKKESKK